MSKDVLERELKEWLLQWKDLPQQGTPEWYKLRQGTVGGSELHDLLHSEYSLVARKIGFQEQPVGVVAMLFGSVFEFIVRNITETLFDTTIYETSSLPSIEVKGKTFSMDGIGVVGFKDVEGIVKYLITLFEYKCPFSRAIVYNEIPKHYIPQVKSGLSDIGIAPRAMYIETVIRTCSIGQLAVNDCSYNTAMHDTYRAVSPRTTEPIVKGFMLITSASADAITGSTDLGTLKTTSEFGELLQKIKNTVYSVHLSELQYSKTAVESIDWLSGRTIDYKSVSWSKQFKKLSSGLPKTEKVVGVLPFKIIDMNMVLVEKETGYTLKFKDKIEEFVEIVSMLNSIECVHTRKLEYNKIYGHTSMSESPDIEMLKNLQID